MACTTRIYSFILFLLMSMGSVFAEIDCNEHLLSQVDFFSLSKPEQMARIEVLSQSESSLNEIYRIVGMSTDPEIQAMAMVAGTELDKKIVKRLGQEYLRSGKSGTGKFKLDPVQLQSHLDRKFTNYFTETEYRNFKNFQKALKEASEESKKIGKILKDEQVEVAMHRTSEVREKLTQNKKFLNQYESGTSSESSLFDPQRKEISESASLGITTSIYKSIPFSERPKFAVLRPKYETGLGSVSTGFGYGDDVYVFKLNNIKNRSTLTAGDSFINEQGEFSKLHKTYVPWKYRELMTPYATEGIQRGNNFGLPSLWDYSYTNPADAAAFAPLKQQMPRNSTYIETQIWGELSLDDVEKFEFSKTPPSGEFLDLLEEKGIQIIDRRQLSREFNSSGQALLPVPGPVVWRRGMD